MSGINACEVQLNDPLQYLAPLPYTGRYYPYGFPVDVATDAHEVLDAAQESFGVYAAKFTTPPLRVHVFIAEGGEGLPPSPVLRGQRHLLMWVSDRENFSLLDRRQQFACCYTTRAVLGDRVFFRWHFLDAVIYMLLELNYFTSLHAASIAWEGSGILLLGESGAGKSTLAYACARRGWTYVSDDASSVVWGTDRTVIGEPHHFRFREEAVEIFPELRGLTVGRQLDRKPTIEVRTATLPIRTATECRIDRLVWLERRPGSGVRLVALGREQALERWRQDLAALEPESEARRAEVIARIAALPAFRLRYGSCEDAVLAIENLVRPGKPQ
jgi:hypothetical protein